MLENIKRLMYNSFNNCFGGIPMKFIKTVVTPQNNVVSATSGCGECRSSCQSACKTSCTVGNQVCEQKEAVRRKEIKK